MRAHCAPILGLSRHADPQSYWERRCQLSEHELARLFLPAASSAISATPATTPCPIPVSTNQLLTPAAGPAAELVRLEEVAEQAAQAPGDYAAAFDEILAARAARISSNAAA
ncbi:hypothetical protein MAHJHV60_45710 [Mycobacterium avium subsp. hominissuis]